MGNIGNKVIHLRRERFAATVVGFDGNAVDVNGVGSTFDIDGNLTGTFFEQGEDHVTNGSTAFGSRIGRHGRVTDSNRDSTCTFRRVGTVMDNNLADVLKLDDGFGFGFSVVVRTLTVDFQALS